MEGEKARILVVDDEFGIREGCRLILDMEGYEVDTAEDGVAGLELFLRNGGFAVGLIDLKMPRMGGIELIEKIRARDEDIILFVITAYADFDTAVEATKKGAYGYIPKPFTADELLLPIRRGLERRALALEAKRLRAERESRLLEVAAERSKSLTIIKCMTEGVLVINRERQVVLMNDAARRAIPGAERLELPAALPALAGAEDLADALEPALAAAPGSLILSREVALGKNVFMVNVSPMVEAGAAAAGAIATLHDITALKELDAAKSMFVSMVAHEVKRPLGVVEGYLQLVLSGLADPDPKKQRELLERALLRARALREMVSELMNLTAMETGQFILKRAPLDLALVLQEAVEAAREKAREKAIELTCRAAAGAAGELVLADREAMLSVCSNLIDNAIKYTPEGGHVEAVAEAERNYLVIQVRDDGIGMSPQEQEKLFEEFYRVKNQYTAKVPGTGLGLSLVKRLVEMHQGQVKVESAPAAGSVFSVCIPRRADG